MRRQILENRVRILFQQLELIRLYRLDFVNELGKKGVDELVDEILDEINFCNQAIANWIQKNNNMEDKINIKKHIKNISENLKGIRQGIRNSDLSLEDTADLKSGLLKAEMEAYKIKLEGKIDALYLEQPSMMPRDVLMQMYQHLRPEVSQSLLPDLTNFILKRWELSKRKSAA